MLDTAAEDRPDRRPAMLVCVYEDADPVWPMATLEGANARILAVGPDDPAVLAGFITGQLDDDACRAVLLVGRTRKADRFRIQLRAENRALTGGKKLAATGPSVARATAPASEMLRALGDAGFSVDATSESEDDAGSYLLYRVLTALPDHADAVAVGLLRTPATLSPQEARRGVEATALAMARHLSPLPRARLS